jgi:hypothetical protein
MVYLALHPSPPQARSLRSGLFARGTVELGRSSLPALPLSAVHVDESRPYVLVFEAGTAAAGLLTRRTVVLGERGSARGSDDEWVEIRSGLSLGARVLSGAVGTVPSGTPARQVAPAGAAPQASSSAPVPTAAR